MGQEEENEIDFYIGAKFLLSKNPPDKCQRDFFI